MLDQPMKTEPWAHQREDLLASRDLPGAAFPWEPRVGKTKLAIDTAAYLFDRGKIDAVVVVAPNGVHLNWSRAELPTHWPLAEPTTLEWESGRWATKRYQRALASFLEEPTARRVCRWLFVNVEALVSPNLQRYLDKFVRRHRCLLVCDESIDLANPKATRTKVALRVAARCPYRRILDGTMAGRGPFGLWSQYALVDPTLLGPRYTTFKARYGVFKRTRYGSGPAFDELVDYQNLDELQRKIAPVTFPRKKAECFDLPARLFTRRPFVLPPEHRRVFDALREELLAELADGGTVSVSRAITCLLRLQQVSRGYVTDDAGATRWLGDPYPAVEATVRLAIENPGKVIVWCRFTPDVARVAEALRDAGVEVYRCDGSTPSAERPGLIHEFNEVRARAAWVGTTGTGGRGIDLPAANLMIFYSHGFDLVQREQALERNYSRNQTADRCDVVDLVGVDTPDERALAALARKASLSDRLDVRELKELLT